VKKDPSHSTRPALFGILTFIFILAITVVIAFQQINFQEQEEKEKLTHELNHVKDRFRNILYSDITAANSLAIFYKQYGLVNDFDSIASQIIRYNKYAEALQLTVNGIIMKVYPLKGYEKTIGMNTENDSIRLQESKHAFQKNAIYFAGPRKLRQGGIGILGKVPIRTNKNDLAVGVVLTKLETIQKALNLDADPVHKFSYWLVKKSDKTDNTAYFLSMDHPADIGKAVYTEIPEGDWIFGAAYSEGYSPPKPPFVTFILGGLLALLGSILIYRISSQPFKLKKIIAEKTKELADQEKYYRTLIHTSTDAIVLIGKTGKIIYQTPSADRIIGYTYEEIQQLDGTQLLHPDSRAADNKAFEEFLLKTGSELKTYHRIKHKDGHYIWIEGTYLNLLHDETIQAIVLTYSDITQRKHLEDERQHLLEERLSIIHNLTSRNKDLEQFSFIVSHNIRAPLANILGLTAMFSDPRYDEILKAKAVEGIQISAKNLDAVLAELNTILQARDETAAEKPLETGKKIKNEE
jgi:PAS domain S-box-containing protein